MIWCAIEGIEPEWRGNCFIAGIEGVVGWVDPGKTQRNFTLNRGAVGPGCIPSYTASLDAAMTLVPVQSRDKVTIQTFGGPGPMALVYPNDRFCSAATPALALCAAALRAMKPKP